MDRLPNARSIVSANKPIRPDVKLAICDTPEEQERSRQLIAELITNEVASVRIETFDIAYLCTVDGEEGCECGDLLGPFPNLINRGGAISRS